MGLSLQNTAVNSMVGRYVTTLEAGGRNISRMIWKGTIHGTSFRSLVTATCQLGPSTSIRPQEHNKCNTNTKKTGANLSGRE